MASAKPGRNAEGDLRLNLFGACASEGGVVGLRLTAAKDSATKVINRNPNETTQVMP
jgi:hypothetical protein